MRIGIPAETIAGETRVAATPETVKKMAVRHQVIVQSGAGSMACVTDDASSRSAPNSSTFRT
jgi:NAD(P) transhydrogenase subunit alpha